MAYLIKHKEERGWDITNNVALDYELVAAVDPVLHSEVTNVSEWNSIAKFCRHDYLRMRDHAKECFVPLWDSLDQNSRMILACHFVYPATFFQGDLDAMMSKDDQLAAWLDLERDSKICRERRWEAVRRRVSFFLSAVDGHDLYTSTRDMSMAYKDADTPELICWVTNAALPEYGIDFATSGFAQKSYYADSLRDMVVDILVGGNY